MRHFLVMEFIQYQERIPCPNDPKHTVNKSELEEHLAKRCNSRLSAEPWIVHNLNFIEVPGNTEVFHSERYMEWLSA